MQSNLDKYKLDLESLIKRGNFLLMSMQYACYPDEFEDELKKRK